MAKIIHSAFVIFFFFNLVISIAMAVRDLDPNKNLKKPEEGVKHPETYFYHDRGYLIPGVGRGIKPKSLKGFNPFTYNPITGDNNGIPGITVPGSHGGGGGGDGSIPGLGGGGSYLPGGDDTLDPNVPVVEAPNPASGDDIPAPDSP